MWLNQGEDNSVVCCPCLGPVQRLELPAIYANTSNIVVATMLDKRQSSKYRLY